MTAGQDSSREQAAEAIQSTYREEWARIVGGLLRRFGDLGNAEDAAAEAFASASRAWPIEGVPENPGAWLTTTAHRRAIDALRREERRRERYKELMPRDVAPCPEGSGAVEDDRLRLLFTCCHPVLPGESQVALTLRMVGGLRVPEIARAFLVRDTTMGQRISRAKARIRDAGIPYRAPEEEDLPGRIDGVLAVIYLIFNEGYLTSSDEGPALRPGLTSEAIRLARLTRELCPGSTEATGLLALMLFTEARARGRLTEAGELVPLGEQDRSRWDRRLIDEALELHVPAVEGRSAAGHRPGRYELMAAISAAHSLSPHAGATDWRRIVSMYEELEAIDPGPMVSVNKAIAIFEAGDPGTALETLDGLPESLGSHHRFHAVRAEVLRTAGRPVAALEAYERAIHLASNPAEAAHLTRRRDALASAPASASS